MFNCHVNLVNQIFRVLIRASGTDVDGVKSLCFPQSFSRRINARITGHERGSDLSRCRFISRKRAAATDAAVCTHHFEQMTRPSAAALGSRRLSRRRRINPSFLTAHAFAIFSSRWNAPLARAHCPQQTRSILKYIAFSRVSPRWAVRNKNDPFPDR